MDDAVLHDQKFRAQQHLDVYFEQKARDLLPDPEKWVSGTRFQGLRVKFGAEEVKTSKGIHIHYDPVAVPVKCVTVKFKLIRPDKEDRAAGAKNRWETKSPTYEKPHEILDALAIFQSPPEPDAEKKKPARPKKEDPVE